MLEQSTNETKCSANYKHCKLLPKTDVCSHEIQYSPGMYWIGFLLDKFFTGYRITYTF
jgi:hypothetical protein